MSRPLAVSGAARAALAVLGLALLALVATLAPGSLVAGTIPPDCRALGWKYPPFEFTAYQPQFDEANQALGLSATGALVDDPMFQAPLLETGPGEGTKLVAPFVPNRVWKALNWVESNWNQAELDVPRGHRGPVLISTSCAYGISQQLNGMEHTTDDGSQPTRFQRLVGTDYRYNIARGVQELAQKWNYAPYRTEDIAFPIVGDRVPKFAESWFYAVWAYHGMTMRNHPANPDMPWPRPRYNSPEYNASGGCKGYGCYPYQELVYDLAQYPPEAFGVRLWQPFESTPPAHALFVTPRGKPIWPPPDIPLPAPAHQDRLKDGSPALAVAQLIVARNISPGLRPRPVSFRVRNTGTGSMGWRASLELQDAAETPWVTVHQSRSINDGTVTLRFKTGRLPPGRYDARLRIDAPLSAGSPITVPVTVNVTGTRSFVPGLSRAGG